MNAGKTVAATELAGFAQQAQIGCRRLTEV
jgi:hypothetical protein